MSTKWIEGISSVLKLLEELTINITHDTEWKLYYPSNTTEIDNVVVLKKSLSNEDVFIELCRPNKDLNFAYIECRFGTNYILPIEDHEVGDFKEDCGSLVSRFSWFTVNTNAKLKSWLPVKYWLSINNERIMIVLQGDVSANYKDSIMSFGYFGSIEAYTNSKIIKNNFGMSVSSDISPFDYLSSEELETYSSQTGTGVIDFTMLETSTGFPFQRNFISFTTPDEFMNRHIDGPSNYTKGYHFSKLNVCGGYEGNRGYLSGITVGDSSSLTAFEEIAKYDENTGLDSIYEVFLVNAPYSILNNSPNVLYAIAILKSDESFVVGDNEIIIAPTQTSVVATSSVTFRAFIADMEITNLDETVWSIDNPDYTVIKGVVYTTVRELDCNVTVYWNGHTAQSHLIVTPAVLTVHPDVHTVDVGTSNIVYKATLGELDVTDQVTWNCDDSSVSRMNEVLKLVIYPGIVRMEASINFDGRNLSNSAILTVIDQPFVVTPLNSVIEIDSVVQFKAMLGRRDVTAYCDWTIPSPYTIDSRGLTSLISDLGNINVNAKLSIADKSSVVSVTIVDTRVLKITPVNETIEVGTDIQFRAMLGDLDVSSSCTWTIIKGLIDSDGTATNLVEVGINTVYAHYNRTNKDAQTNITIRDYRVMTISPWYTSQQVLTSVQYKAMIGGVDITNDCVWSIDNIQYHISSTGLVDNLRVRGVANVTAYYTSSNKTVTTRLTITDNRTLTITGTLSVMSATGSPIVARALLDGVDVTDLCTWSVSSPYYVVNGIVYNTSVSGAGVLTAVYNETGTTDTETIRMYAPPAVVVPDDTGINHTYDLAFMLDWPSSSLADLDLYATWPDTLLPDGSTLLGDSIYYGAKNGGYSAGEVILDHDVQRKDSTVNYLDSSQCETVSISGMVGVPITLHYKNYNGAAINGAVHLRFFDSSGRLLRSFSAYSGIFCTVTRHANGTYSI